MKPAISRTDDIESLTKKVTEEEKKEKLTPAILTSLKVQKKVWKVFVKVDAAALFYESEFSDFPVHVFVF